MKLESYKRCIFCGSLKLKLNKNQTFAHNFYTLAIKNDLKVTDSFFKKMKLFNCQNCHIIQNNPWFSKEVSFKIFNQIYGQHNRNWLNAINFFNKSQKPNHGNLFDTLNKNINIKNYCEFNSPFMGLMIDFFSNEYNKDLYFYKSIFNYSLAYLSSRQVAGIDKSTKYKNELNAKKYLIKINKLKDKNSLKKKIKKTIIIDNSFLGWLYNDNYKSVNSRSLASELFNIKFKNFDTIKQKKKYDLFGIFHSLDHTHQPKKILDYALNNSKYVLIYCHVDEKLEKQHLFSFTDKFIDYLKKNKIYCINLNFDIKKDFKSKEIYILCSKFHKINIRF